MGCPERCQQARFEHRARPRHASTSSPMPHHRTAGEGGGTGCLAEWHTCMSAGCCVCTLPASGASITLPPRARLQAPPTLPWACWRPLTAKLLSPQVRQTAIKRGQ